jgi:hypothetical protein
MNEEEKSPPSTDDSPHQNEQLNNPSTDEPVAPVIETSEIINPPSEIKDMEVHHHAHDPAAPHHKKNWKSYFWEFFMLFLAVTLGFFIENQREHYIEKQRAKQLAVSLTNDLENDLARFNNVISARNTKKERFNVLMDELEKTPDDQNDTLIFYIIVEQLLNRSNMVPNTGTYQQIKNSGSLRYFETAIASELIRYEGILGTLEKSFELDDKYLIENVVKLREELCNPRYLRLTREEKKFDASAALINKDAATQLELYKALNFLLERNQIYLRQMTVARERADSVLSKLKKYYSIK